MADGTQGVGTLVLVSADGTAFEPLCVFGDAEANYGTTSVNEEFCLSSEDALVSFGDTTYPEFEYIHKWEEGNGSAGNKIVKDAKEAKTKIWVRVEANNSGGTNGTQYTSEFFVTAYKHNFKRGEIDKTTWSCKQLTKPVEVASA